MLVTADLLLSTTTVNLVPDSTVGPVVLTLPPITTQAMQIVTGRGTNVGGAQVFASGLDQLMLVGDPASYGNIFMNDKYVYVWTSNQIPGGGIWWAYRVVQPLLSIGGHAQEPVIQCKGLP